MLEVLFAFVVLVAALLAAVEVGFRIGKPGAADGAKGKQSVSILDSYVMTLLGLLLAFGFYSARDEFNNRNELVLVEAHSIRTTQLNFEMLDSKSRGPCISLLSQYLDSRRQYNNVLNDREQAFSTYRQGQELLSKMNQTLQIRDKSGRLTGGARDAIGAMEIMDEKAVARHISIFYRRPDVVLALLVCFSLMAGVLLGMGLDLPRRAQRWHRLVFALVTAAVLVMILDYANPRAGMIRVNAVDQALDDIRT